MCDMRLQVSVNNNAPVRASLDQGWLSVHLNLSSDDADRDSSKLRIVAIDKSQEPNSIISTWELGTLSIGDAAQIQVLNDGEADPPSEVKRTAESPNNLFADIAGARELLTAISVCDRELNAVLRRSQTAEPEDEFKKLALGIGAVFAELDRKLIQPTLRRHPELLVDAKEKGLI
jgi:hypothetical protein